MTKNTKTFSAIALAVVALGVAVYSANATSSSKDGGFANFESADKNSDGVLDRAEFSAFLKSSIIYGKRKQKARWDRACEEIGAWISRATAWAIWDGMVKKSPLLAIFQTWDKGHGGRQAEDFDADDCRQVQMLLDFANEEGC